jgi:hypothetical protein
MTDGDNRIRLDQTPVDFSVADYVPELHSNYPAPNTQARYDQARSYLIGLLSNQSSDSTKPPFEKREGTLWYQKDTGFLTIFNKTNFDLLANHIGIEAPVAGTDQTTVVSLSSLLDQIRATLQFVGPKVVFCAVVGYGQNDNSIQIPDSLQGYAAVPNMQAMVYADGKLVDPRLTTMDFSIPDAPGFIRVHSGFLLKPAMKLTIVIEHVDAILPETFQA